MAGTNPKMGPQVTRNRNDPNNTHIAGNVPPTDPGMQPAAGEPNPGSGHLVPPYLNSPKRDTMLDTFPNLEPGAE